MKIDVADRLVEIESWLENGEVSRVRAALTDLLQNRIERRHVFTVAMLCRCCHLPERAVRILHRYMYSSSRTAPDASEAEKAEYAASLNAIGCNLEAQKLLQSLNTDQIPKALLFHAYTYIWQWDWDGAVAPLEKYLAHPKALPDPKLWAKVNLGLALTHGPGRLDEARILLEEVSKETVNPHQRMVHKNALVNLLQNQFVRKDWKAAQDSVRQLESDFLGDGDSLFESVLELWKHLVNLYSATDRQVPFRAMRALRMRFREAGLWENMRACDYYEAALLGTEKLLLQLYFGTPFPAFRARVKKTMEQLKIAIPSHYEWFFFQRPEGKRVVIELANGQNSLGDSFLKEGQVPLRLLQTLGSDFYKPMQIAELHERIYPELNFDPITSANRVHQATRRLRTWLEENKIPLEISEFGGFYALSAPPGCAIKIQSEESPWTEALLKTKLRLQYAKIKKHFGRKTFFAAELPALLEISYRSSVRVLNEIRDAGLIERVELGPQTHYKIRSPK